MELIKETRKNFTLPLGALIPLHESGIDGVKAVSRKIDEGNLQALLYAEKFPPLLVQKTNQGYILIDGHHRMQAVTLLGIREYAQKEGYWPKDEEGEFLPPDLETYKQVWVGPDGEIREFTERETAYANEKSVSCVAANAGNEFDLCRIAWRSNRENGLQPAKSAMGHYGLWLYQKSREEGRTPLAYSECAREAGCSKSTIVNYSTRHAGDSSLKGGDMPVEAKESLGLTGRREKDARALARAMARFLDHSDELTKDELSMLLSAEMKASEHEIAASCGEIISIVAGVLKDEFELQPA